MTRPKRFGSLTLGLLLFWSTYSAAQQFPKSAMVKPDGKETDVMLNFEADKLLLVPEDDKVLAKEFLYGDFKSAEYSFSSAPRYKTAIFVAWPLFFLKGKKHWLTIVGAGDSAILHLDKKNYKAILAALESKSSIKVETVQDEK